MAGRHRTARQSDEPSARPYGGKPLHTRRSEQRERILNAARDVFAARGYGGAGIDEIVSRARVSRTTFYVFFANKEECLLAVFAAGLAKVGAAVAQVVAQTGASGCPPTERIRSEVRAVAGALAADPAMARIILIEIVGASPAAERARARMRHAAAGIIEGQLERYEPWRRRSPQERRIASLGAMAAIAEPIGDLVATGRLDEWETLVGPISEFVARGLTSAAGS